MPSGMLTEAEQILADELGTENGVTRLSHMIAVHDMRKTMRSERTRADRESDAAYKAIWGGTVAKEPELSEGEELDIMSGRDVHFHYHQPTKDETPGTPVAAPVVAARVASAAAAPAAPVATPKPSIIPSLLKIGLGAVMAGTGVGLPFALPSIISGVGGLFSRTEPAAVSQPATSSGNPSVIINGEAYELSLEGGEKDEE